MTSLSVKLNNNTVKHTKQLTALNKRPDLALSASFSIDSNTPSNATPKELERTPGAVAVSGVNSRALAGGNINPLLAPQQTNSKPSDDATSTQYVCGSLIIFTECEKGIHHFAKKILCGKEWCPICGEEHSQAHNRRIARWLCKVQQIKQLGYLVVEFPDKYRKVPGYGYSKRAIRHASNKIVEVLAGKRLGRKGRVGGYFERGLLRWHWFGEKKESKWNPHCNILVDSGFIEPEKLLEIKQALREALNCPDLIVHYSFAETPGEIYHKLKYVTRATFNDYSWNPYMANQLYGFRNGRWWGKWNDEPAWELTKEIESEADMIAAKEINLLGSGICPDCGAPLKKWARPVDSAYLTIWGAQEIGKTGYYRIPHKEWQGGPLTPEAMLRLEQMEIEAKAKPSVELKPYMVAPNDLPSLRDKVSHKYHTILPPTDEILERLLGGAGE